MGWELDGCVGTEVRGEGPEIETHIPSIFSRISLVPFLTHRSPEPRCPLKRTVGLRQTLQAFSGFPMIFYSAYVHPHSQIHDSFPSSL